MGQEILDATVQVGGPPRQHVLEVDLRAVPIEPARLHETWHARPALAKGCRVLRSVAEAGVIR